MDKVALRMFQGEFRGMKIMDFFGMKSKDSAHYCIICGYKVVRPKGKDKEALAEKKRHYLEHL